MAIEQFKPSHRELPAVMAQVAMIYRRASSKWTVFSQGCLEVTR